MTFTDRVDAGRRLAAALLRERLDGDVVVLGIPRGGIPVAFEVATALDAPLDLIAVRKLGVPWQPELAMGAIGEGGVRIRNEPVLGRLTISERDVAEVERRERIRLAEQSALRGELARVDVADRTAIVIDDGIATGSTARAACAVARAHGARHIVLAAPVAAADAPRRLRDAADRFVFVATPHRFSGVGQFYADFRATPDQDVTDLLRRAAAR